MAIEYGITDEGFVIKTLDIIKQEIDDDLKTVLNNNINLLPESVLGTLRDKFSERLHELWELFQLLYNSVYPQTASGMSLDNVCDYAVIERLEARASTIIEQALFGTVSTVIPAGTQISVDGDPTTVFETDESVTLIAGTDEVQTISFSATPDEGSITFFYRTEETSALAYNDATPAATLQTYLRALDFLSEVVVSGSFAAGFVITFSGADGKQEHPLLTVGTSTLKASSVDVTTTITETTPGVFQGSCSMTCTETGIKNANARSLNVIDTPISGLTSTFNIDDAIVGRDIETDSELRVRRNASIVTSRSATVEAIRNKILDLNGDEYENLPQLTDVIVYENDTDYVDSKNIESHHIMVVVRQEGDVTTRDEEIAQAIFDSRAAGIGTSHGNATGGNAATETITDSTGIDHEIKFIRPDSIDIYLILDNFETDSNYPIDGDDQLKAIIVAWGNNLGVGTDIIVYPQLVAQIALIPGILDFDIKIGTSSPPTLDDNIDISDGISGIPEYSNWSTTNITINHI
jgi:uncharacterized phage protein gp47/JayE